jgi:hypothetical protein
MTEKGQGSENNNKYVSIAPDSKRSLSNYTGEINHI